MRVAGRGGGQGALHLTYESAAVRLFNEGRTETIRSVSLESRRAVELLEDPAACKADKIAALKAAAEQHQRYSRDAGCGQGVDRSAPSLPPLPCRAGKE